MSSKENQFAEDNRLLRQCFIVENFVRRETESRFGIFQQESSSRSDIFTSIVKIVLTSSSSSSKKEETNKEQEGNKNNQLVAVSPSKPQQGSHDSSYNRQRAKLVGAQLIICNDPNEGNIPPSSSSSSSLTTTKQSARKGHKNNNPDKSPRLIKPEDEDIFRGQATSEEALRLQFDTLDRNRNGFLEKDEFKFFFLENLEHFGLKPSDSEFEERWKKVCGADQKVNFREFSLFMLKRAKM
jgi:hypothetical protein